MRERERRPLNSFLSKISIHDIVALELQSFFLFFFLEIYSLSGGNSDKNPGGQPGVVARGFVPLFTGVEGPPPSHRPFPRLDSVAGAIAGTTAGLGCLSG